MTDERQEMPSIPGSVKKNVGGRPRNETKGLPVSNRLRNWRRWYARQQALKENR